MMTRMSLVKDYVSLYGLMILAFGARYSYSCMLEFFNCTYCTFSTMNEIDNEILCCRLFLLDKVGFRV